MWYRDYALVRERARELDREARSRAAMSALVVGQRAAQRGRRQRVAGVIATGVRWFGRHTMALATRLDDGAEERSVPGSPRKVAYP